MNILKGPSIYGGFISHGGTTICESSFFFLEWVFSILNHPAMGGTPISGTERLVASAEITKCLCVYMYIWQWKIDYVGDFPIETSISSGFPSLPRLIARGYT